MATFLCRTKGNSDPKGKPRVYFTCHPEDFSRCFDKLCEDIFKTHDCAIYYTEDMREPIAEQDKATDLGQMNLYIVPVTLRLLTEPNRAMDDDLAYAKQQRIPILPFMMEPGLDAIYAAPEKFGERQYLSPYSTDVTEIGYADKLKKHLESVLIGDAVAKRVRAAFDAYIFLSYRKKDRRYANALMRLIHATPECRDIAIWYDEFLTPGESFSANIEKAMQESRLFALLVTPSLLEEPGGKQNFVMRVEYPAARAAKMNILPAEMEKTDRARLCEKFEGIPECIDATDEASFRERLLEALVAVAHAENDGDPEHNFLIGLAYLDGIDVEIDRTRALHLITSAAEAGLPEAMEKLYDMYSGGLGVDLDYRAAAKWVKCLAESYERDFGEEHPMTLRALNNLAALHINLGDYQRAGVILEGVYAVRCRVLGEEHPDTLLDFNDLAVVYGELGEYRKAKAALERISKLLCKVHGEDHSSTLLALHDLAAMHRNLGEYREGCAISEKVYALLCGSLGEEHPSTLLALGGLATAYSCLGDYQREMDLRKKQYDLRGRALGEAHPDTLRAGSALANTYCRQGRYQDARELLEGIYPSICRGIGEEHPDTVFTLTILADAYHGLGDHQAERALRKRVYALRCKILGEEHPSTLVALNDLAGIYYDFGEYQQAIATFERLSDVYRRTLGEGHPNALTVLNNLAVLYVEVGEHQKAITILEGVYASQCKLQGEEHPETIGTLSNIAGVYHSLGDYLKAGELMEQVYASFCRVLGEAHPHTLAILEGLVEIYYRRGDMEKATELYERALRIRNSST